MPTEKDGDSKGYVLVPADEGGDGVEEYPMVWMYYENVKEYPNITHWLPASFLPPLPVETEEGKHRQAFEKWARDYFEVSFIGWDNSIKQYEPCEVHHAWLAYLAALNSTKTPSHD